MAALRDILKDCNFFADRENKLGNFEELKLPTIEEIREEYYNGGMAGKVKIGMAGVNAMEYEFKMTAFDRHLLERLGYVRGGVMPFTVRGALVNEETRAVSAAVAHLRGRLYKVDYGSWKRGSKVLTTFGVDLYYYKLALGEQGEETVHEIDVLNGIMIVNGFDQRADIRRALGVA